MGIKDPKKKYEIEDMVRGDCLFAATGVTTGADAQRREVRQGHDRDRHRGDALGHRHGAADRRRAPPAREIPSGLMSRRCQCCCCTVTRAAGLGIGADPASGLRPSGAYSAPDWAPVRGAAGAVAADCAAAAGPDVDPWHRRRPGHHGRSPEQRSRTACTSAPMPKPEASTNSVPVASAGIDGSSAVQGDDDRQVWLR